MTTDTTLLERKTYPKDFNTVRDEMSNDYSFRDYITCLSTCKRR